MMKILVVDDEHLVRLGMRTTIDWEAAGIEWAGEAADGLEGLELAIRLQPDLIITDISMPFMDGIELMEQLRSRNIDSKIIVLSGYDDFNYAKGAITYGASDYILKPVENDKLLTTVSKLAELIRKERLSAQIGKEKLIGDLIRLLKKIRLQKTPGNVKLVEDAKAYIHAHYADELTVSTIAERLYISPSYFMHLFKESTFVTVNDYLTEYRITQSKRLLKEHHYKIYEVCEMVGFRDPRHFGQMFKRYTHLTPREYMKNCLYE